MHYFRWKRHGDPLQVDQGAPPVRDEVGYWGVHSRLRKQPATTYSCRHCAEPAAEWAYDRTDPNERQHKNGPFSLDLDRYMPLCIPCHRRFDAASRVVP